MLNSSALSACTPAGVNLSPLGGDEADGVFAFFAVEDGDATDQPRAARRWWRAECARVGRAARQCRGRR
eukprot:7149794-Prymnesium_polylepis.2